MAAETPSNPDEPGGIKALGTPRGQNGWDRRRAHVALSIEEAALQLFIARGIGNVTMQEIADEAAVSRSTLFRYFASREDIIAAHPARFIGRISEYILTRPHEEGLLRAVCDGYRQTSVLSDKERNIRKLWREAKARSGRTDINLFYRHQHFAVSMTEIVSKRLGQLGKDSQIAYLLGNVLFGALVAASERAEEPKIDTVGDRLSVCLEELTEFLKDDWAPDSSQ